MVPVVALGGVALAAPRWRPDPRVTPSRSVSSRPRRENAFHDGGEARLVYIPSRDVVLAVRLSKPLHDEDQIVGDIDDLIFAIADRRN